jgi:hypothetical protein
MSFNASMARRNAPLSLPSIGLEVAAPAGALAGLAARTVLGCLKATGSRFCASPSGRPTADYADETNATRNIRPTVAAGPFGRISPGPG